ncbi:hypothetical protein AGMMS49921_14190 [Endomicrobiia bacterium]|nr:hypothetical protein AGMMS49921_14190 [Endomicrobiia bacterium]
MTNEILYDNNPHFNVCGSNHQSRFDFLETTSAFVPIKYFKISDYPKISQKRALEFVKKCFNPTDFTFVFVGDIDLDLLKSYIKTYIASISPIKTLTNQIFVRPKPLKKEFYTDDEYNTGVHMSWVIEEKYSLKLKAASKVFEKYIKLFLMSL